MLLMSIRVERDDICNQLERSHLLMIMLESEGLHNRVCTRKSVLEAYGVGVRGGMACANPSLKSCRSR
jgi:hypothetical protein